VAEEAGDYWFVPTRVESVKGTLVEFKAGPGPPHFGSLVLKL